MYVYKESTVKSLIYLGYFIILVGIGHAQILANNSRILFLQVSQRSNY